MAKKITKKKTIKKVASKVSPIEEAGVKSLTQIEMLKLENMIKDMRLKELESLAITHKKKILDLEFEKEQMKKHNEYKSCKEVRSNFLKELTKKYELSSELKGFDPITGDIKDE